MKWSGGVVITLLLAAGIIFSRCGGSDSCIDTVATPITEVVDKIKVGSAYYKDRIQLKTGVYYRANEYQRSWLKKGRPNKMYKAFVDEVRGSARYGFNPADYDVNALEKAVDSLYDTRKRTSADISELDIRITATFFLFTTHLIEGRVRYPGAKDFVWERGMPLENDIALLMAMDSGSDLRKKLDDLHPKDAQYERLQDALQRYRQLAEADTLPWIPQPLNVEPGDRHEAIAIVRRKLRAADYKLPKAEDETVFDPGLAEAIKDFQERHGLDPEGKFDRETVRFLNIPFEAKANLIAVNLERLRWHPRVAGKGDEIVVNVPEYMLRVYRNGNEKMRMRVVLGAQYTPTPVFADTLKYIVFNPTWAVPQSIFAEEFLPRLREDPSHYDPERFSFFKNNEPIDPLEEDWNDKDLDSTAYRVVENPGEKNSLGKVKFIMPNDHSIYLHDTPADQLFTREDRALSHGCIRLEKPEELANYLLPGNEWSRKKIEGLMESPEPVHVDLPEPVPVYIVYRTAWVEDRNVVHFREDIYGHDERHLDYIASY